MTTENEFKAGSFIEHPTLGKGQVVGVGDGDPTSKRRYDTSLLRVEFRQGLTAETKLFKRHILASLLDGEGVPYRDRHGIGDRGDVCLAPSTCDQPSHSMRQLMPRRS